MEDIFVEKITKNLLSPPTNRDFSIKKWKDEWKKIENEATVKDKTVYEAGLIIDGLLSGIREKLTDLYKQAPKITLEKLILALASLSNRDITVALKLAKKTETTNIYSTILNSNPTGSSYSLQEIAHGSVDGIQLAIRNCLVKISKSTPIKESEAPIDEIDFILKEHRLSQLYSSYEHLWQCVLWSSYELTLIDANQSIYSISQPKTPFEIAFEKSAIRQSKLHSQRLTIANSLDLIQVFSNEKFITIKRKNKKRVAAVSTVKKHDDQLTIFNSLWHIDVHDLKERLPKRWFEIDHGNGFSINDILEVMRCLRLLALEVSGKFPTDDSFFTIKKLLEFCPRVGITSLSTALNQATNIALPKLKKILGFLTANSSPGSDLWSEPLLKINNEYAILVGAIAHPNLTRLVEHWIRSLNVPLDEKGYTFEELVLESLNERISSNKLIQDYNLGVSKRFRLENGEEEFDILVRIGNLILVGECKCIVTTDSEISKYRTANVLNAASLQVIRKTEFLKNNIETIFSQLGWSFKIDLDYKYAGCVINSGGIFVSHNFNGIPVVDELILNAYFESPKIRIFSVPQEDGSMKDLAWYELYDSFQELKENLPTYLTDPPQLLFQSEHFEYKEIRLPYFKEAPFKIIKRSLVSSQINASQIMQRQHKFRVCKSLDYEKEISEVQIFF